MILALALAGLGVLVALFDWRKGLLACLAVGFLQDPLRKLAPDRPVAFVVLVGVVFVACAAGYLLERGFGGIRELFRWYPKLRAPLLAFTLVVVVQSLVAALRTGSLTVAGIGLLSYVSPVVALVLGLRYCDTAQSIGRWQRVYLAGAVVVGVTILLAFAGVDSPLFDSIGKEIVYSEGRALSMVCGIMRSSEIAAWHAATGACLVMLWAIGHRHSRAALAGTAVIVMLLFAVLLTGRRKTLGEILVFLVVFSLLLLRWKRGKSRLARIAVAVGLTVTAFVALQSGNAVDARWSPYVQRSTTVFADAPDRLWGMTVAPIWYIVERNGWLGQGAGTGAQGAQYFGGGVRLVGSGAEGGLGRVVAELGVPGFLCAVWLTSAVAAQLFRLARKVPALAPHHAVGMFGLIALLPANAAVFLSAHQIFGDPFVLIVMGFIISSALSYPQIVSRELRERAESAPREAAAGTLTSPPAGAVA